jgi:hypothetical protein
MTWHEWHDRHDIVTRATKMCRDWPHYPDLAIKAEGTVGAPPTCCFRPDSKAVAKSLGRRHIWHSLPCTSRLYWKLVNKVLWHMIWHDMTWYTGCAISPSRILKILIISIFHWLIADIPKKVFCNRFLRRLNCLIITWACEVVFRDPHGLYRNGISVVLCVSFCSLSWFCENINYFHLLLMHSQYRKNLVFDGVLRDLSKSADVICLFMCKFNIPDPSDTDLKE